MTTKDEDDWRKTASNSSHLRATTPITDLVPWGRLFVSAAFITRQSDAASQCESFNLFNSQGHFERAAESTD